MLLLYFCLTPGGCFRIRADRWGQRSLHGAGGFAGTAVPTWGGGCRDRRPRRSASAVLKKGPQGGRFSQNDGVFYGLGIFFALLAGGDVKIYIIPWKILAKIWAI